MTQLSRWQRFWNDPGPDRGWSWAILATSWAFLALTIGFSTTGSTGILFLEFVRVFNVTRKDAAWPFSAMGIAQCITGLFVGMILHCFEIRLLMLFCAILCASGMALCFVATELHFIALALGLLYGVAIGIIWTACLSITQQYFKKYLATANGFVLTAMPLSGTFLPYLMDHLVERYGLRGAMLMYSGVLLQLVILVPFVKDRTAEHFPVLSTRRQARKLLEKENDHQEQQSPRKVRRLATGLQTYKNVVTQPLFYVITLPAVIAMSVLSGVSMTILDFALDIGLTKKSGLFLSAAFAFADVLGRLGSGFVADRGWIAREKISAFAMILMAASLLLTGLLPNFYWMGAVTIVSGLMEGSVTSITNVLYTKHLGVEKLSTALGLRMFASGILAFIRPLLIGSLRDSLGSHYCFYCIMGGLSLATGLLWIPVLCRTRREEQSCDKSPADSRSNPDDP